MLVYINLCIDICIYVNMMDINYSNEHLYVYICIIVHINMSILQLSKKKMSDLRGIVTDLGISSAGFLEKDDYINSIMKLKNEKNEEL